MPTWSKDLIELTSEIGLFLEDLLDQENATEKDPEFWGSEEYLFSVPEMAYADAIIQWRKDSKNANSWFSTDSKFLLYFKDKLVEKYGLSILTHKEGRVREIETRRAMPVYNMTAKRFLN